MSGALRRAARALSLEPVELARSTPILAALTCVLASLYVLKPARTGLFLDRVGIDQLPIALLATAGVGALVTAGVSRLTAHVSLDRLIRAAFIAFATSLIGFRIWLPRGGPLAAYVFFIWVNLYGLVAVSLVWIQANRAFDARSARRTFGIIATGGIAGAILGGLFTRLFAKPLGTENLLFACAALDLAAVVALARVRVLASPRTSRRAARGERLLSALRRSRLLLLSSALTALLALASVIIDVRFSEQVDAAFPDADAKTAFLGAFFALLNAAALVFQLFVAPRVLRSLGVMWGLGFLPASLSLTLSGSLLAPGLTAMTLAKAGDVGFRHSIHKSATEILTLPLPTHLRARVKVFLDTTLDAICTGGGAVLILLFKGPLGLTGAALTALALGLVVLGFGLLLPLRRAYLDEFRRALDRGSIDLAELRTHLEDASALAAVRAILEDPAARERQVAYLLELISPPASPLIPSVRALLGHPSSEIQRRALRALLATPARVEARAEVQRFIASDDPELRLDAVRFLYRHEIHAEQRTAAMRALLTSERFEERVASALVLAELGLEREQALLDGPTLEALLTDSVGQDDAARAQLADLLGFLETERSAEVLVRLMNDASPVVAASAARSLAGFQRLEDIPRFIARLVDLRRAARSALATFGVEAVPALARVLHDSTHALAARRQAARVLADIPAPPAVDHLLAAATSGDFPIQKSALEALAHLRHRAGAIRLDRLRLQGALIEELRTYVELRAAGAALHRLAAPKLICRATAERAAEHLERAFLVLGLSHGPRDMRQIHRGVAGADPRARGHALEYLDNVLTKAERNLVLPILEAEKPREAVAAFCAATGRKLVVPDRLGSILAQLMSGRDPWLAACAVFSVDTSREGASELGPQVEALMDSPDAVLAETARHVFARLRALQAPARERAEC